ncbi:uncharacterized protein COLE_01437 [Cutaneotrichosporon oleaginosum]|uniref:uncharacterized protein n=1 Tax=Cutaneotrichosporon oleaginosum TaxID=879819 RepID=UPI0013266648|nr:hypothetical protein COLE_01437 [Cutaneotrichosporon oleaginosum]
MLSLLLLAHHVLAQTFNDQPSANDSATEPYWPQYPDGTSASDFMMNTNSSDADLRGESRIAQWIVTASNVFRAQFGNQPVTWNETAARIAQEHVNTCLWEHWADDRAQLSYSEEGHRFDINPMVEMWAEEWDYYPFRHPEAQAASHFTAMMWNASNTLGCAWNVDCANTTAFPSMTYFVCNYWPIGNIATQPPGELYALNVPNWTKWTPEQVPDVPYTAAPVAPSPTASRTGSAAAAAGQTGSGAASGQVNGPDPALSAAGRAALPAGILVAAIAAAVVI